MRNAQATPFQQEMAPVNYVHCRWCHCGLRRIVRPTRYGSVVWSFLFCPNCDNLPNKKDTQ